jgi:hypothetical protein
VCARGRDNVFECRAVRGVRNKEKKNHTQKKKFNLRILSACARGENELSECAVRIKNVIVHAALRTI